MWLWLVVAFPIAGMLVAAFAPRRVLPWIPVLTTGLGGLSLVAALCLPDVGSGGFSGAGFGADILGLSRLSALIAGITAFVQFTAALYSVQYLRGEDKEHQGTRTLRKYVLFFELFCFTLAGAPLFHNVLLTWAFIEGTALSSVLLVDFHHTAKTHEASWKYLIIMEVGGLCALLGTLTLLSAEPSHVFTATWAGLERLGPALSGRWLLISFVLVLAGYGAKAGLVPFHFWLPDAHSEAPSPASAMLSAVKLNCALYGIIRVQRVLQSAGHAAFANHALLGIGLLTVLVCVLMTIVQRDFKRLFAYSSAENMGMAAIGFALGPIGVFGGMLQMVNHSVIKSMLFYHAGELQHASGGTEIASLRGIVKALPWTGGTLTLGFLAIAGAPPFGLFVSELVILYALFHAASPWLAALVLASLALLFANFLRYALGMLYSEPTERMQHFARNVGSSPAASLSFGLHATVFLALGVALPFVLKIHG